jgi:hypothetical protein
LDSAPGKVEPDRRNLTALVPITIKATRVVLCGDQRFPRRSTNRIEIGDLVLPAGIDLQLEFGCATTGAAIEIPHRGEPDLELVKPEPMSPAA